MSGGFIRNDSGTCFGNDFTKPIIAGWVCEPDGKTSWRVETTSGFDIGPWEGTWGGDAEATTHGVEISGFIVNETELVLTAASPHTCSNMCR